LVDVERWVGQSAGRHVDDARIAIAIEFGSKSARKSPAAWKRVSSSARMWTAPSRLPLNGLVGDRLDRSLNDLRPPGVTHKRAVVVLVF
jgi:hypothetical protein